MGIRFGDSVKTAAHYWQWEELQRLRDQYGKVEPSHHTFLYSEKVTGMFSSRPDLRSVIEAERAVRKNFFVDEDAFALVPRQP
jgi:hypothetical protein